MAGDRRATAGYTIASRRIEKVFPADDFSGVAIAGAAGPAVEMVKLFQTQLEHYEKVQGDVLSLEGKANQLGQLVRANLPAAMQGFVGRAAVRRLRRARATAAASSPTTSPAAATRSIDYQAQGSGSVHARNWIKAGWREGMPVDEVDRPRDPGAVRGGRRGRRHRRPRPRARHLPDASPSSTPTASARSPTPRSPNAARPSCRVRERGGDTSMSTPFYVSPEQVMKDRADYARKGISRGRSLVALECAPGVVIVADNPSRTLQKISEIYDRIAFAAVGCTASTSCCASRACATPTSRATRTHART